MDARDDDVLGGGRVDGGLGRHRHLLENALVRRVRELNERRYLPVAQVPDHLLLEQRLLHVRRVDGHGQPPALDLLLHREQRAARRRRVLAPGAIHLADRALERQRDVRRDPEHVALLAVHNWRVRHRRLEARAPAEHLQRATRRPRASASHRRGAVRSCAPAALGSDKRTGTGAGRTMPPSEEMLKELLHCESSFSTNGLQISSRHVDTRLMAVSGVKPWLRSTSDAFEIKMSSGTARGKCDSRISA